MSEDIPLSPQPHQSVSRWAQHRFLLMIGASISISIFLVGVALALYANSGAEQLDLSRPGYVSVRNQAVRTDTSEAFPSSGPVDSSTISQFRSLYNKQAQQATSVDSFGGNAMDDNTLGIDAPSGSNQSSNGNL